MALRKKLDDLVEKVKIELFSMSDECDNHIKNLLEDIQRSEIQRFFDNELADKQLHHRIRRRFLQLKMRINCLQRKVNQIIDKKEKPKEWCPCTGNPDRDVLQEPEIAREWLHEEFYGDEENLIVVDVVN